MFERQDADFFPCFPPQECCAWTIPEIANKAHLLVVTFACNCIDRYQINWPYTIRRDPMYNYPVSMVGGVGSTRISQ